jgi:hypothetical protein
MDHTCEICKSTNQLISSIEFGEGNSKVFLCGHCWAVTKFITIHMNEKSTVLDRYTEVQKQKMIEYNIKWSQYLCSLRTPKDTAQS